MLDDRDAKARSKLFGRRAALLAGAQGALFSVLAGRLYYLQVVESDRYTMLADENRINFRLLPPPRGRVLDRTGEPLAINQLNYRLVMVAEQTSSVEATLNALSGIVALSDGERRRIMREAIRKRSFVPIVIRENLSWDEVSRISVNGPDLPGVTIDVGQTRHYPQGRAVAHVIGYVAPPAEADLTGDPLLELPEFRIGRQGVERSYDLALRGRAGASQVEVNAIGRVIRELERKEGAPGHDVTLTLDVEMQAYAATRMGEESGAAVVMDVHNGDLVVLQSNPAYDPNDFNKGISQSLWQGLLTNPRGPLTNKAIAGQYAPGSTFKMMVALACLENNITTPETRIHCPGHLTLGDTKFHCWKKEGHGSLDLVEGLRNSCDVQFYELAKRAGIERIAAMSRRFGLGQTLGIDMPGERGGLIPSREWKLATTGVPWQQGETLVAGIGQGFVLTTPLQLATMTARLVNGGFAVVPRLTRDEFTGARVAPRPEPGFPSLGIAPAALAFVQKGMNEVVNNLRGTAYKARIVDKEMAMAGKTGTAQVRRITEQERRTRIRTNEELPWTQRDHALFVGYAPISAPRYAAAVIIEHGGGGSTVAAPIVRDLLLAVQKRDKALGRQKVAEVVPEPRPAPTIAR